MCQLTIIVEWIFVSNAEARFDRYPQFKSLASCTFIREKLLRDICRTKSFICSGFLQWLQHPFDHFFCMQFDPNFKWFFLLNSSCFVHNFLISFLARVYIGLAWGSVSLDLTVKWWGLTLSESDRPHIDCIQISITWLLINKISSICTHQSTQPR